MTAQIWLANSDATRRVQLIASITFANGDPAWSPDGKQIAFMSENAGNGDIWVIGKG